MSILGRVNLSNENYEGPAIDSTEAIIEGDLAYADAMELAQEAKLDAQAMMTLEDATQALEAKISNEEYLLANPEKITTEVVALANESYGIVCTILGGEAESLSVESIESSPVSAMNISHEGVKDFLTKLYDSIKLLFKKIGNAIKKIVVKLVVAMNGVEKAAKKLKEKLTKSSENTPKETKLKDNDAKVWNKYLVTINTLVDSVIEAKNVVHSFVSEYTDLENAMVVIAKNVDMLADELVKVTEKLDKIDDVYGKAKDNGKSDKFLDMIIEIYMKLVKDLLAYGHNSDDLDLDDDVVLALPITFINNKPKAIIIKKKDDKKEYYIRVESINLKTEKENDGDINVMSKKDLIDSLDELTKMAKGLKKFSDNRMKEIDTMYKTLDKLAENKTSNSISKFMLKQKASYGTNIRAIVAGGYLDSIMGYSSVTKKLLGYCRDHAEMYKSNEL